MALVLLAVLMSSCLEGGDGCGFGESIGVNFREGLLGEEQS